MYLLYSSLLAIGFLISIPYWAFQMLRHGKYGSGLGERLGRVASRLMIQQSASVIWVHAVSVGEVQAVTELISGLRQKFSQHRVVISGAGLRSIQSPPAPHQRSEEHTSELQSRLHLVCRLLLVNKNNLRSLVVIAIIAIAAQMTLKGLLTPARLAVLQWTQIAPAAISLPAVLSVMRLNPNAASL